jgi:integrase
MARKRGVLVPIDGIKAYQVKGRWYHYDRESGVRIVALPGTPEFLAEIQQIRADRNRFALPQGSLGDVIAKYKNSETRWGILKPATKKSYERAFAAIDRLKRVPLASMSRPSIIKLRDDELAPKHGRWLANYVVTVLGILFGFAFDHGIVRTNPLAEKIMKIRKPRNAPRANRPWTPEERATVLAEAPPHIRLPLALAMCTGLRYSDLMSVTLAAIRDNEIAVRTSKRDAPVRVPIHPVLVDALGARPQSNALQICVTHDGKAWKSGFNASWSKLRTRLEGEKKVGPGLTLHGLRHTLGAMLKEAGLSDGDIADVLGQSGTSMARHYSREAALPDNTKAAVVSLKI